MEKPHNLYIHVPFCASKCNYCAFYSRACADIDWDNYAQNIISEIKQWADKLGKIDIPTIFFGGGTPSLMPVTVFGEIMDAIRDQFNVPDNCEVTIESNPGTITRDRLIGFMDAGVNRLSVGIQSLNDTELQFLGRKHSAADAVNLIKTAMGLGLHVSGDFIYGLPGQTVADVAKLCKQINDLGIKHCSMYELSIEAGTPFSKMNLVMPDNETMAKMYEAIANNLNLPRYEVSNYGTHPCLHNQNIWDGDPYIGIGDGAAGRPMIGNTWYEQMGGGKTFIKIDTPTRALEKIITGLRTMRGVRLTNDICDLINFDFVNNHPELVTTTNNRLAATQKGILILNDLLVNLVK